MAITGISSYDGKQIIAAGAQSAIKAYKDSNNDVITSKYQTTANMSNYQTTAGMSNYQTTAGMSNYQTTAGMSNYATTASVTGKQDALTFGYTDNQISQINGSAIYSQGGGGGGYTGNVQQALDEVYSSSATWNTVSDKLDAASQVVTATGGTTTYVQTINGKNISATNAGSALSATNAYNLTNTAIKVASATSASTAYTLGNTAIKVASATSANYALAAPQTQSDWSVTDTGNVAYIKNKPSIWTPTVYHYDNVTTLTAGRGQQIGSEGIYVKFNPGNFLTSYTINDCRMIAERMTNNDIWHVLLSIRLTDVIGTQWTQKSNAIVVTGGHMANGPVLFNCYSTWAGTPWCQFGMDLVWETAMYCINREIRNSSTADNNSLFINVEMEIHKA